MADVVLLREANRQLKKALPDDTHLRGHAFHNRLLLLPRVARGRFFTKCIEKEVAGRQETKLGGSGTGSRVTQEKMKDDRRDTFFAQVAALKEGTCFAERWGDSERHLEGTAFVCASAGT